MTKAWRELRLVPVVLYAASALFVLKSANLLLDGGYALTGSRQALAQSAAVAGDAPRPNSVLERAATPDSLTTTGSTPSPAASSSNGASPNPPSKQPDLRPNVGPVIIKFDPNKPVVTAGERVVLERLNERRQELESRSRDLDLRESLLKAAEKQLENRLNDLKELEAKVGNAMQKRDEAETARFKSIVMMYESMKSKDAAKIFDRLDKKVLIEVAEQINPRRLSDIVSQMSPEAAERLTVELATRASGNGRSAELPKIEGRPTPN